MTSEIVFSCFGMLVYLCTVILSILAMLLHYDLCEGLSYTVGPYSTILIGQSSNDLFVDQY